MILLYAASREPRRGETPVTRASAVPAAALAWGSSVEYRQLRKSKKAAPQGAVPPRYGAASSALRQKYGDRPPPLFFSAIHSLLSFNPLNGLHSPLLLIPRTILIFVPQGKIQKRGYRYGSECQLLRHHPSAAPASGKAAASAKRSCGVVAARIAADSGADIMISL